jgi:hypothetical protein
LIGGFGKLGNGAAIILSIIGFIICIVLLIWASIWYLPSFNKVNNVWAMNPFDSPVMCCSPSFYNNPKSRCPNGMPNYAVPIPCVHPNDDPLLEDLTINVPMLFAYISLFWYMFWYFVLAIDAYLCIEDITDIVRKFGALATMDKYETVEQDEPLVEPIVTVRDGEPVNGNEFI